jgi:hypothetical protein
MKAKVWIHEAEEGLNMAAVSKPAFDKEIDDEIMPIDCRGPSGDTDEFRPTATSKPDAVADTLKEVMDDLETEIQESSEMTSDLAESSNNNNNNSVSVDSSFDALVNSSCSTRESVRFCVLFKRPLKKRDKIYVSYNNLHFSCVVMI